MTLPDNAQAHLLAAFQSGVPTDPIIPPDTRYRMYAERVVHRPLPSWQALTLEEARLVFKHLGGAPTPAPPSPESLTNVLRRVDRRQPLNAGDHAQVLALIRQELMHVTPEFDRSDRCPYRLTAAGQAALQHQGGTR